MSDVDMKKVVEAAAFNKQVKEQIEQGEDIVYTQAPLIVINYPNDLDIRGGLTCEGHSIPDTERTFIEPSLFVNFFLLNRNSIAPRIYQRWALISGLAAMIGRNCYTEEEGRRVYPNMYIALVGESGAGKSTAIDMVKPLMKRAGYAPIADAATTKDKFLMDMHSSFSYSEEKAKTLDQQLDEALFESEDSYCEGWICCSEWNEYFRTQGTTGNFDFINTILPMYDCPESMATRSKVGGSIYIRSPTLNIIGGSTINNLLQFAPILSAEPFYSRTTLVYSPPTNRTYSPSNPEPALEAKVVAQLQKIRDMKGKVTFEDDGARELFDTMIAESSKYRVPDTRLNPYYSRRNLHLRKLSMIIAIAAGRMKINVHDVMHANSILTFTESFMQRALSEYGGLRQGIAESVIMQELNSIPHAITATELIQRTSHVVESMQKLGDLIGKLSNMGRIGLSPDSKYFSKQKTFRIESPLAMIKELYEYY